MEMPEMAGGDQIETRRIMNDGFVIARDWCIRVAGVAAGAAVAAQGAAALHVVVAQVVQATFFVEVVGAGCGSEEWVLLWDDTLERDNRETSVVATRVEWAAGASVNEGVVLTIKLCWFYHVNACDLTWWTRDLCVVFQKIALPNQATWPWQYGDHWIADTISSLQLVRSPMNQHWGKINQRRVIVNVC